ncbi:unnamed protein product [Spirodela intermedia]|uniref:E3 ubiquitin-protein ligase RMA n=1 Tax=Spirodela intermedia TaxID=51605 RepID=A0A7I8IYM7_SPIIN|nr:unnamed protein product [Spirodela intermedia]CAA6662673.1 unnamed protein product [Spirodela intermedia]
MEAAAAAEVEHSFCGEQLPSSPAGSFDCNICLEDAAEPVVTLCGHLYCWPCIYKWLHLEGKAPACPVCKAAVSQTALVPLYGRGYTTGKPADVPRRPPPALAATDHLLSAPRPRASHQWHHHRHLDRPGDGHYLSLLGGTAVAVLPWVLGEQWMGLYYTNPYEHLVTTAHETRRLRRQELSLHRISVFLFCCLILCLLLF